MSGLEVLSVECDLAECLEELAAKKGRKRPFPSSAYQKPEGKKFSKCMFLKEHGSNGDENTLFVANVGATWTKEDVTSVFDQFGVVEQVEIGSVKGCRFARVTFEDIKSMKKVMLKTSPDGSRKPLVLDSKVCKKVGSKIPAWLKEYQTNRPGNAILQEESETFMANFAKLEAEEARRRAEQEKKEDDDGFTLVSYSKGAKNSTASSFAANTIVGPKGQTHHVATVTGSTRNLNTNKKKKKRQFDDFYRFQTRDKKRDELAELRSKFEQDKIHINRLKSAKAFKPFS